jgi:hypothetical protein
MIENVSELKQGDGGYVMDQEGDIRPVEDWLDPSGVSTTKGVSIHEIEADRENERTQQERLDFVRTNYGFYPKSADELASIIGIDSTPGRDAGRHMSFIMRRQYNLRGGEEAGEELARKTAFEIARQYINYRNESRGTATFLKIIYDEALDTMHDEHSLSGRLLSSEGGERRAVANVVRSKELTEFVNGEETDKTFDFGTNADFMQKAEFHLLDLSNESLRESIEKSLEEERRRLNFWQEKLKQLGNVTVLTEMANRAVTKYNQ